MANAILSVSYTAYLGSLRSHHKTCATIGYAFRFAELFAAFF